MTITLNAGNALYLKKNAKKQLFRRLTDYQNNYKNYQNPYLKHMRYYQFDVSYILTSI